MKERIRKIMESQHMTQKVFAQFTGISEGSLSGGFNVHTRPTLQVVDLIHQRLPNISTDWLMYGQGPMYRDEEGMDVKTDVDNNNNVSGGSASTINSPLLFSTEEAKTTEKTIQKVENPVKEIVKYIDKPARKITEIRVFYDDQTWESFSPGRS